MLSQLTLTNLSKSKLFWCLQKLMTCRTIAKGLLETQHARKFGYDVAYMVRTSVRSRTHILNCCDIHLYQIAKYRYLFKKTLGLLPNCFRDMFNFASQIHSPNTRNRPLALGGHVTIASFKQRVGILLMPKIDRAHKNCLAPAV